jgi:hypothetical protein
MSAINKLRRPCSCWILPTATGKRGAAIKYDRSIIKAAARKVPFVQRQDYRSFASVLGIPFQTLWKMTKKEGIFKKRSSKIKPNLTDENKEARVSYALAEARQHRNGWFYDDMMDRVHVDEKWFRISKEATSYIIVASDSEDDEEEMPTRTCRHKSHISKVMFVCAQARPRHDPATGRMWDGKIGMWPVGRWAPATRGSVNRPAGTMVWHDESVDKDVYRSIVLYKIVPAIQDKWPRGQWARRDFAVRIQHDGASAHMHEKDTLFELQLRVMGLAGKIRLYYQPANSPDCNICDLGLFRALQSMAFKRTAEDVPALISHVLITYNTYDPTKINKIFLTLMSVLNCIIETHGGNEFPLPHMGKDTLHKLPRTIAMSEEASAILLNS